jgi:hypothetical protein
MLAFAVSINNTLMGFDRQADRITNAEIRVGTYSEKSFLLHPKEVILLLIPHFSSRNR